MTGKTVLVLALILGLAAAEAALACSYLEPPPPKQARDEADAGRYSRLRRSRTTGWGSR